jgi:MFS family permease
MWGVRLPRELWALTVGGFLVAVGYGLVVPALPALAVSMGVGVTAVSAVVGAFALARIVGAPVAARLIRLGAGRVFCAGLVVVALSSAACAVAGDYAQLLAFRTVGGLGSMMFTVAAAPLIIGRGSSWARRWGRSSVPRWWWSARARRSSATPPSCSPWRSR